MLDAALLRRVRALPNVRVQDETDVVGVELAGALVTGARVLLRSLGSAAESPRPAW